MRLALYHNLPSGGAKRALYEWFRRLSPTYQVDVFTLTTADHDFCDLRPFVDRHYIYEWQPSQRPSPDKSDGRHPFERLNTYTRWRDLRSLEKLNQRIGADIESGNYDLLFANPCQVTHIPSVLAEVSCPTLYYLHEPFGQAIQRRIERPYRKSSYPGRNRWVDRLDPLLYLYLRKGVQMEQKSLQATQMLLANSHFTSQKMRQAYGVEARVCYLGVDTQAFTLLPDRQPRYSVFSVGELTPRKGFDFLIESLSRIPATHRPPLRIASNWEHPPEKAFLHQLAKEKGVDLQLLGRLTTEQLCQEYNSSMLYLYAPLQEPFGLAVLESMACGTPVIGVAEGGLTETIQDQVTGLLVERDEESFARATFQLLSDSSLRLKMGRQARAYITETWSWESAVARLESNLSTILLN